jgi:hypothetical protein
MVNAWGAEISEIRALESEAEKTSQKRQKGLAEEKDSDKLNIRHRKGAAEKRQTKRYGVPNIAIRKSIFQRTALS